MYIRNRIQPIFQTENFLLPKRKPITEQMDSLNKKGKPNLIDFPRRQHEDRLTF